VPLIRRTLRRFGRIAACLLAASACARAELPIYGQLQAFELTDQHGREFTLARLHGRPFLADFIFTRCAGVCPGMTSRMARLRPELPDQVALVSFTVDPSHDTPAVLARYAEDLKAPTGWIFATGSRATLYALATNGFKLAAMEVPEQEQRKGGDGPFLHSSKFVLVDAGARVRGYYDSEDPPALERLVADARRLVERTP
jgi:protein SCO1/2